MKNVKGFICTAIACMLCACSSASEPPEISAFPTLSLTESEKTSETAPSATQGTPTQSANTADTFVPDESAPIKLSLSFTLINNQYILEDSRIYKAAMEYMRRHPDVYFDLRHEEIVMIEDAEAYQENLIDALSSGTAVDITLLDFSFPIKRVAAEATLVNFEELIESDSEVKRTDFFENILDAVKYEDALYVMPLTINVNSLVMNKEYTHLLDKPLEEYKSLDYRDMMKVYDKATAEQTSGDAIYMDNNTKRISAFFDALDLHSLDYEKRNVDIYNEETRDFMEKALSLPLIPVLESVRIQTDSFFYAPEMIILFPDANIGAGFSDGYLEYEDFKYTKPIPVANFNGDIHFNVYQSAIISKNCQELDTAWDFLKFLMGYDKNEYETDYNLAKFYQGTPITRDLCRKLYTGFYEKRYEANLEAGRTPPYPKEEAIERAVTMTEKKVELATKRGQANDSDFMSIWYYTHYANYNYRITNLDETLKALERDLLDLLSKY